MGRRRNRGGWSLGTIVMLTITGFVIAGCVLLYPKLTGDIAVRVDPSRIAVAFDSSFRDLKGEAQTVVTVDNTPLPASAQADYSETQVPTDTPAPATRSFSLTAGGSICVDSSIQKVCTTDTGYRFDRLLEPISSVLPADLTLATLENTCISTEKLTDVNAPTDLLSALHSSGLNTLCIGFNGALNNGVDGLSATINAISSAGMTPYGLYPSAEARNHPTLMNANGVTVALLSYQNELSSAGKKHTTKDEQAFLYAKPTLPTISADISAAKAAGAQVIIVSLCWGKEGSTTPSKTQRELAQSIADAGADVILGTHSGTLQPVELLTAKRADGEHPTLCAYSLGNLLSSDREKRTTICSILLHVSITYRQDTDSVTFDSLTYTPTYVWRGKEDGQTGYRVLLSNATPPAYVESDQQKIMEKCLTLVREIMSASPVREAN